MSGMPRYLIYFWEHTLYFLDPPLIHGISKLPVKTLRILSDAQEKELSIHNIAIRAYVAAITDNSTKGVITIFSWSD